MVKKPSQQALNLSLRHICGLQKSGTSGQKQLNTFICGAAIKRCDCTAGQDVYKRQKDTCVPSAGSTGSDCH